MFTGIVEETGQVIGFEPKAEAWRLTLAARTALIELVLGDSIAVNGCCLTVTAFDAGSLAFDVLEETRREQKVKTMFGRVRPIPDINSKNANMRGFAERTAVNTPLQGTAADLIKLAMIQIDEELRKRTLSSRMLLQVHDELVFEVPERERETMRALVKDKMENVRPLSVPLSVEISTGLNWRDVE